MDNLCEMRITACFLWSLPWIAEQQEMAGRRALRGACGGSNNAFTAGNGHHPGRRRERGRSRETGPSRGYLAPAGGARRAAKTSQLASRRGEAGRGPSISYMEGPCLIQPGGNVLPGPAPRQPRECRPR